MAGFRFRTSTFTWAPRALAVISCAVALLAAQPALGTPALKNRPVVLEAGILAAGDASPRTMAARPARPAVRGTEARLFGRGRSLHILATMEILHRLLVGELQPVERHIMPVLWFEPSCLGLALRAAEGERMAGPGEAPPNREREFAIGHCLLAPPVS